MLLQVITPILLAIVSAASVSAAFTVTSPSVDICKDVSFTVDGYQGEYHATVLPSVDPCEHDALVELGPFTSNTFTWHNVEVPAGTSIVVVIDDESDGEAWTQTIIVGGNAADCPTTTSASQTTAVATSNSATSARPTTSTDVPVNAADAPDNSSAAFAVQASWMTGILALLAGSALLA